MDEVIQRIIHADAKARERVHMLEEEKQMAAQNIEKTRLALVETYEKRIDEELQGMRKEETKAYDALEVSLQENFASKKEQLLQQTSGKKAGWVTTMVEASKKF